MPLIDSIGITNPSLHIVVPALAIFQDGDCVMTDMRDVDSSWWPSTGSSGEERKWRVLQYRRRVGRGEDCYQAVRDAALDWEFHDGERVVEASDDDNVLGKERSIGIIPEPPPHIIPSSSHKQFRQRTVGHAGYDIVENVPWNDCAGVGDPLRDETAQNIVQIWSCATARGGRPGRRMITYSEVGSGNRSSILVRLRLPSLFAVNPVAVVYDLVDQRGPSTTFTSTAYATLRGHLLCGEERVTVALRDGNSNVGGIARNDDNGWVDVEVLSYSRPAPSALGRLAWPLIGQMQGSFFAKQLDALEQIAKKHEKKLNESSYNAK